MRYSICPHDSVTSDLVCGQWRLAAREDVLMSDARFAADPLLCVCGPRAWPLRLASTECWDGCCFPIVIPTYRVQSDILVV